MLIKVCGLKYRDNIEEVLQLKPDYAGFNFYPQSPRHITGAEMVELTDVDFGQTKKVGVFVNESIDRIFDAVDLYDLDYVQLHGEETPNTADMIRKQVKVIKAIGIETKKDIEDMVKYKNTCDYILLDKKSPKHGGTGLVFDWDLLQYYPINTPFFLAGGLTPQNIEKAMALKHSMLRGLDLNSGFEDAPGLKNIEKLKLIFKSEVQR